MKTHQNQSVNKSRAKCWLHRRRPGQLTKRPDYVPHQSPSTMITLWRSTPLRTQHSRVAQVFKTPFSLQPSALRLQTPSTTPNPIEHPQSRMSFYYKRKDKQQNGANIVKVSACCRCCFCSRCCSFTGFCCSRQSTGMGRMPPPACRIQYNHDGCGGGSGDDDACALVHGFRLASCQQFALPCVLCALSKSRDVYLN